MFRANLYRNVQENGKGSNFGINGGESFGDDFGVNSGDNFGDKVYSSKNTQKLTDTQKKILACIAKDKYISAKKIAEKIGMSRRTVENNIKNMKAAETLVRHGSPKYGYWEIVE